MDREELDRLRKYYHSLLGQQRVFEVDDLAIAHFPVNLLEREIQRIWEDFPDLIPEFNKREFLTRTAGSDPRYSVAGIRSYLAAVLARLKIEIDEPTSTPVTEYKVFTFVTDQAIRSILERDYQEIQRAFIAKCWKSVIILTGGAVEAILMGLLLTRDSQAKSSSKAPKSVDIRKWSLNDLIEVAVDLKLVSAGIEKLSHSLREYRNLIHPGNEVRSKLVFDAEEAKIALEVLNMLHRDLSP